MELLIAAALGFLAGIGVGGGSLLMLWLTMYGGIRVEEARVLNLMFFLASAGAASFFRLRERKLPILQLLPGILTGCVSSAAVATVSSQLDTLLLSRIFGWLLILTGLRELFYRPRKAR